MSLDARAQALIEQFYAEVHGRRLKRAAAALAELRQIADHTPSYHLWCVYFEGILTCDRDHDWAAGERCFRQVLEEAKLRDTLLYARTLLALGLVNHYLGRWSEAIRACQQSMPVFAVLERPIDQATALKQCAISVNRAYVEGEISAVALDQAIGQSREALAVLASCAYTVEVVRLRASIWNTLSTTLIAQGRWDEALDAAQHNLTLCTDLGDRHCAGIAQHNLGDIYWQLGVAHWPAAEAAFSQALAIAQEFGNRSMQFYVASSLALLAGTMGEDAAAWSFHEQAITHSEALRTSLTSPSARADFASVIANTFAQAVLFCVASNRPREAFDLMERARSRAFLDLLAASSPALASHAEGAALRLAEIQAALPADALLVEYFTMGQIAAKARRRTDQRYQLAPARTLIFAVTHDSLRVFDVGLSPNDLSPGRLAGAVERQFLSVVMRRMLYDKLLGPLTSQLAGKRRLYIVPHGPLHYVPFQALIAPDGETLLRPGGPQLVYGPSASVLFRDRAAARPLGFAQTPRVWETPCLALGFDGEAGQRLRFAEEEASRIAVLLGGDALVGPASKRAALFQRGPSARFLHISCHGQFDPDAPLESSLHLCAGETVTAREVLDTLRLGCELVTLSACESGLSLVRRGDELMGLVRAFMAAGAPAVLATQWRVDERSTRLLMERFYRAVAAGASFAPALHAAQLYLRDLSREDALSLLGIDAITGRDGSDTHRPFADPFYWAPFILIGRG